MSFTSSSPRVRRIACSILTSVMLACVGDDPISPQTPDLNAARRALAAADSQHAAATSRGLLAGMPSAWTEDVTLLWPTLPAAFGRARATAVLQSLSGAAQRTMTWYPVRVDVSADGEQGYSYGYGTRTSPSGAGTSTTGIQYIAYWVKDTHAQWRVRAWTFNAAVQPLPTAAPAGCETPTNPRPTVIGAGSAQRATAEVLRADSAFAAHAARTGAEPAFIAFAAADAAAVGAGERIVCGPAASAALFAGPPGALLWSPQAALAAASGDLAFTFGVARVDGASPFYTKYLTVWKRQRDGAWRFVVDGGNAAPAP